MKKDQCRKAHSNNCAERKNEEKTIITRLLNHIPIDTSEKLNQSTDEIE